MDIQLAFFFNNIIIMCYTRFFTTYITTVHHTSLKFRKQHTQTSKIVTKMKQQPATNGF